MLKLENLYVSYGSHRVIDGLSMTFDGGKLYGIIGPNGAGKSTLLNAIARDIKDFSGEVFIENVATRHLKPKILHKN